MLEENFTFYSVFLKSHWVLSGLQLDNTFFPVLIYIIKNKISTKKQEWKE